jgi:CDP-4-dehydro-6-deoxyglucose reductase, E3
MPLPPTFDAHLVAARALSPQVRELTFERKDGAPFAFDAGQWVSLILPLPTGEVRRSYSIASWPNGSPRFEVAITHVQGGPGSTYLHELPLGHTLRAIGPQGFFTRGKGKDAPALFVGTGTGVTPLRSMLHDAARIGDPRHLTLLFGVRRDADRLYEDELRDLAKAHPSVRVEYTLSQPGEGWPFRRGYVQTHVRELYGDLVAKNEGPPHVYICGLERMVSSVRDLLRKDMGLPREQVHSERYD